MKEICGFQALGSNPALSNKSVNNVSVHHKQAT